MRILYHHRTVSNDGQVVHINELISALRRLGHDVEIVAPTDLGTKSMGSEDSWARRLKKHLPKALYEFLELGYSLVAYRRLLGVARRFKPDVIYERYNLFLVAGVLLKRRLRIPLLLEVNAPLAQERKRFGGLAFPAMGQWAEDFVWQAADYVLPVTRVLADHIASRRVSAERIVVIPNAINRARLEAVQLSPSRPSAVAPEGTLVLGFAGFVRSWHGVDRVIRWMKHATIPSRIDLVIVGDGPAKSSLVALANDLGISDRVHFTGVVPHERVAGYIAAFDVALQPAAVAYASPLKLFEYLALGKAIIAPRQPNIEEVLVDGYNSVLFDPFAAQGLESALTRICSEETLRERVAHGAAETIRMRDFTWEGNALRVAEIAGRASKINAVGSVQARMARR